MFSIRIWPVCTTLLILLLPVTVNAEVRVIDGAFQYKAQKDVRFASVGSEVESPLSSGDNLTFSSQDHLVIRSDVEKVSIIPLASVGDVDVLRSARKLMGFWLPESIRRHAILVLEQYSQELPLDPLCRVLVITERLAQSELEQVNQLAADRGVEIRQGLQEVELKCRT